MNNLMLYIVESTISITAFYFISRIFIKRDTDFDINRMVLLSIITVSLVIPQIQLPVIAKAHELIKTSHVLPVGADQINNNSLQSIGKTITTFPANEEYFPTINSSSFSLKNMLFYIYLSGVLISLLILIRNVVAIVKVFQNANIQKKKDFRLAIVEDEIPSFTFMKSVVISKTDYDEHGSYIFNHELEHIKLKHHYDLVLLEIIKIIFWFNPVVYLLVNDLKQIHEFQADNGTLKSGVNPVQYQLLIIEKSVGDKRFALVNSFNHSQIKKRIDMMNTSQNKQPLKLKLLALTALALLLVFSFSSFTEPNTTPNENYTKTDIQGTWKLISYNYWGGNSLQMRSPETERIKFIKDNSFCWMDIKSENKQVEDSAGGIYNLSGNSYNEFIEFGGSGMTEYTNNEQRFRIKIDDEIMYLSGVLSSGQYIKEVWQRVTP